jgi:hypothetical protein
MCIPGRKGLCDVVQELHQSQTSMAVFGYGGDLPE